jgi:hypothetical protein
MNALLAVYEAKCRDRNDETQSDIGKMRAFADGALFRYYSCW